MAAPLLTRSGHQLCCKRLAVWSLPVLLPARTLCGRSGRPVCTSSAKQSEASTSTSGAASAQQQTSILLDPLQSLPSSQSRFSQPPCWIPPLIFVGITTLFSIIILKNRRRKPAVREADEVLPMPPSPEQDPRAYQRALAKTRQAAHITTAVAFNKSGEPARAYMELLRALSENSTCRSPLLAGHHAPEDLIDLYKLHIKSSEVPPNFATLLQLQEMLGISQEEAEQIELEVLQAPGAFTI